MSIFISSQWSLTVWNYEYVEIYLYSLAGLVFGGGGGAVTSGALQKEKNNCNQIV